MTGTGPRALEFVTVKRNVPMAGRSYGHWWIEVDDTESYGWWPGVAPVRFRDALFGVSGVLNGTGAVDETGRFRDPNHGLVADYEFHPVLVTPESDDDVRLMIREFAATFRGGWQWSTRPTMNCRLFQLALFDSVGLVDGTGNYRTRGGGCPMLASPRRVMARFMGRRLWPRNLPPPGTRATEAMTPRRRRPLRLRSS